MDEELAQLKSYMCNSNDALDIKLIRHVGDLEDETTTFKPDMSHQVFDNEKIFGYKDLKIKLYYAAGNLDTYLGMTYAEKVNKSLYEGVKADEVLNKIAEMLAPNPHMNIDTFVQNLDKDLAFRPEGNLINNFSIDDNGEQRQFEIYKADMTPKFLEYHQRLQTFLLWYIDAANFIDTDDNRWNFFNVYELIKGDQDNPVRYVTVGFATVFQFFAYPEHTRPRISQVLILPPFQKIGLGCELLKSIYRSYIQDKNVKDITVEEPSEDFQRLRDYVDCTNCSTLSSFSKDKLMNGFTEAMVVEACEKFKINKKQARRVYEILKLKNVNVHNDEEYRNYRLEVKNRLNIPYKKAENDKKKVEAVMKSNEKEGSSGIDSISNEENRIQVLEKEYRELEDEYNKVVKRLDYD